MVKFENAVMRLLFGASLLLGLLVSSDFRDTTFLFCLKPSDNTLLIEQKDDSFKVDNFSLNQALHNAGVINLEEWIPAASSEDSYGEIYLNRIYRAHIDKNQDVKSVMNLLNSSYSFLYIERENVHKVHYQPNDPNYEQQCSMSSVKADKAWDFWDIPSGIVPEGQNVLLASVDTGVDYTHPDLKASLWINQQEIPEFVWEIILDLGADLNSDGHMSSLELEHFLIVSGMDNNADGEINLRDLVYENVDDVFGANTSVFLDGIDQDGNGYADDLIGWDSSGYLGVDDSDPYPREDATSNGTWAHGTHVAGILAATTDNDLGMSSTSYNAKIISVKTSRDYQQTDPGVNDGYAGITYAAKAGYYSGSFTIINNSWGGGGYSFSENAVIQNAHDDYGAIVLSSAGNGDDPSGEYSKEYPAGYDNVLSVSAIGCSGVWGNWATYHETVDLAAPGESILSSIIGQGYDSWDGSSMACPNAASAIGLLKAYYPDWDNDQLIDRILSSSDDFIYDLNPEYVNCPDNSGESIECLDDNDNVIDCNCLGSGMVDVYKAIGMDFSPNITLDSYSIAIVGGDGDDVLNPGDSFDLVVTLLNEEGWATGYNIQASVTSLNPSIILSGTSELNVDFLESNNIYSNDSNPIPVLLGEDISLDNVEFIINVTAIGNNSYNYSETLFFDLPISLLQSGYPYDTNSQVDSGPLVVDLDSDGSLEVVFGDYAGFVHVLGSDGNPIESDIFPYDTGNQIWSSPAAADIDLDGQLDIVIASKNKHLYAFDLNGLKFDYDADQYLIGTPVIVNMDTDDELEIAIGGYSSSGDIFVVNHDGTDLAGFPLEINEKMWKGFAAHDLNNNGLDDLVITTDGDDLILVVYDDATTQTLLTADDKFKSSPSVIGWNGDYIVMAGSYDDKMYAVSLSEGSVFEVQASDHVNSSASFIDINETPYAFFGSDDGFLYAVDMNGNALEGWPQEIGEDIDNSVSFADLNGDGSPEAIIGVSNKLYAYHMDGSLYYRFPISYDFSFTSTPSIIDLDNDGDLEIIVGSAGDIVSVDVMESGLLNQYGYAYWNQDRGNNRKTGYYESVSMDCSAPMLGDLNCDGFSDILDIVTMVLIILSPEEPADYQLWVSDLNQDGIIDVLDIIIIVNSITN